MKKQLITWYLPLIFLALLACFMQISGMLNDDVINGIHLTEQLLAGGNYITDFFENNPPLILYVYAPPVLFAKLTTIKIDICITCYFTLLIVCSLIISHLMISKFFGKNLFLNYVASYLAVYILLFFPDYQFGQREHLLLVFTFPYIFSAVLRSKKQFIHPGLAFIIGIAAGIGFSIKPFFLVTPLLIEIFLMVLTKNILAWLRAETLVSILIIFGYFLWLWFAFPAYSHIVAPLALQFYYPGNKQSWYVIFHYYTVIFSFAAVIFYAITLKADRYPQFSCLLLLSLLGFIAAFLIPHNAWGYHTLPAISMAYFLFAFLFSQIIWNSFHIKQTETDFLTKILLIGSIGVIFFLPLLTSFSDMLQSITNKKKLADTPLVAFFNNQPFSQTFTCLSLGSLAYQPLAHYSNARFVGSFSSLWWERGYHLLLKKTTDTASLKKLQDRRNFLIDLFAKDIETQKPKFILVDITPFAIDFDLLAELLMYKNFNTVWKDYAYVDTLELKSMNMATYQVFVRKAKIALPL